MSMWWEHKRDLKKLSVKLSSLGEKSPRGLGVAGARVLWGL